MNSESYSTVIGELFLPALRNMGLDNVWFQQDRATMIIHRPQNSILAEIDNIPIDMLEKVHQNFQKPTESVV